MVIIDNYLKALYSDDNSKEVLELKEELREHLILSSNEFIDKGYSKEESYTKAIEKFDGGSDMIKELHTMLKENTDENVKYTNKIRNIFKNIFMVGALISMLGLWSPISIENYFLNKTSTITQNVENEIMKIIDMKDINTIDTYKNELDKILNREEFKDVMWVKIYTNVSNNVTQSIDDGKIYDENYIPIGNLIYNYKNEKSPDSRSRSYQSVDYLNGKSSSDNKICYELEINASEEDIFEYALIFTIIISIMSFIIYMYLLVK